MISDHFLKIVIEPGFFDGTPVEGLLGAKIFSLLTGPRGSKKTIQFGCPSSIIESECQKYTGIREVLVDYDFLGFPDTVN